MQRPKLSPILFLIVLFIASVSASDAIIAYRSNTGACDGVALNCPKISFWNSTSNGSWGPEIELPTASSPVREAVVKYSPLNDRIVLVTLSDDGNLDAYVCANNCTDPNAWNVTNNVGQVWSSAPATHTRRYDFDFQSATGTLVLVYAIESADESQDLAYRALPTNTLNFSDTTEQYINDTGHDTDIVYTWVSMDRNSSASSNELIMAAVDSTNSDVNAWVWDGSSWNNQTEISSSYSMTGAEGMAVRYAADGSKGMVVASDTTTTQDDINASYWDGASWNSADVGSMATILSNVQIITLKADPQSDDLQLATVTGLNELSTAYWSGSAWNVTKSVDSFIDSTGQRVFDFEWNQTGSTGILVWDTDGAGSTLSYQVCSPDCGTTTNTVSTYDGTGAWVGLYRNPTLTDNVGILGGRLNDNFDIGSFLWNGTNISQYSNDSTITADTTVATFEGFTIGFAPVSSCRLIHISGNYNATSNMVGAPINATELGGVAGVPSSCIKIAVSNVTFDCNGYNITNDLSGTTYGILLNGSSTNISVKNCPLISNYTTGIYVYQTNASVFDNNTMSNNSIGISLTDSYQNNITNTLAAFSLNYGFSLSGGSNNLLQNNNATNTSSYGFLAASSSTDNLFLNNTAINSTSYGFYVQSTANNNNLTNDSAYDGADNGFYITSNSNIFNNVTAINNTGSGFYFAGSSYNLIENSTSYLNQQYGFFFNQDTYLNATNNTAYLNTQDGFYVYASSYNILNNNTAHSNTQKGLKLSDVNGNSNNFTNNIAYNNTDGFYLDGFSNGANIYGKIWNNLIFNNTNAGITLVSQTDTDFQNNSIYNNTLYGIYCSIQNCGYNNFTNNNITDNLDSGVYFAARASYNNFTNNNISNNTNYGVYVADGDYNNFTNNYISRTGTGLYLLTTSDGSQLFNNSIYSNSFGLSLKDSNDSLITNDHYFNNSYDFVINNTGVDDLALNLSTVIFDNPYGDLTNYTNLSLSDLVSAGSSYSINWTSGPGSLPDPRISFNDKYLSIVNYSTTVSIDSLNFTWADSESASYTEAQFELWDYGGGWNLRNYSPNTGSNSLSLSNVNSFGDFALFQLNDTEVPVVTLNFPSNLTNTSNTSLSLNFTATDNAATTLSCALYLDGSVNATNSSVSNNTLTNFTISGLAEGTHQWFVSCNDSSTNNGNSSTNNFTIDSTAPTVTLSSPANNTNSSSASQSFTFTAVDNLSASMNCS
ncbi:right-handed parallel beta-helix repeat-containing protein, partial [Candidatus Micrarchaeota archaeon]|nr:right-handed parallel beta-helix repeat-containing protein [Candidatus Micrarchaeota archaeon]